MKQQAGDQARKMMRMVEVMGVLVGKLQEEGETLDEYQRAQVVQALVVAKQRLILAIGKIEAADIWSMREELEQMEREIKALVAGVNYEEVAEILISLRLGMEKLVTKANPASKKRSKQIELEG